MAEGEPGCRSFGVGTELGGGPDGQGLLQSGEYAERRGVRRLVYLGAYHVGRGQLHADLFHAAFERSVAVCPAIPALEGGGKRDLRDVEEGRDRRAYLGGVAVGGVLTEEQQVETAYLPNRLRERIGRSQSVRAAEGPVGEQIAVVTAEGHGFLQNVRSLRRPHGDGRDRPAVCGLELHRRLDGVEIQRIYDARDAVAAKIAGPGVQPDVAGVRYLFYKNQNSHFPLA